MNKINDTMYVFNLGRNIAGVSQYKSESRSRYYHSFKTWRTLYNNGHVDLSNIDVHYRPTDDKDPFQTDIFILKEMAVKKHLCRTLTIKDFNM